MDVSRSGVDKDGGAAASILVWLTTSGVEKAPLNSGLQLVAEDTIPWLELAFLESHEVVVALGGGSGVVGQSSLLSKLASCTLGMISNLGAKETHGCSV